MIFSQFFRVLFLAVLLQAACEGEKKDKDAAQRTTELVIEPERLARSEVEITPAQGGEILRTFSLLGNIVPNEHNTVKVAAGIGGIVRDLPVKPGDIVKEGDVLGIIESREAADVAFLFLELQQRASFARQAYDREKSLLEKKIGTYENLRNAQNELQKNQLDLQLTTQKLKLLGLLDNKGKLVANPSKISVFTLRSPMDGTVTQRHVLRGEHVSSDQEIFTIINLKSVWMDVKAPQTVARMVRIGQEIQVVSEQLGLQSRSVVIFVSPVADAATRTVPVRLLLPNPEGLWRPGTCATAEFVEERRKAAVRLPQDAVVSLDDAPAVFVEVRPGVFHVRRVVTGAFDRRYVEISQGLEPQERVVTKNALFLKGEWLSLEN